MRSVSAAVRKAITYSDLAGGSYAQQWEVQSQMTAAGACSPAAKSIRPRRMVVLRVGLGI